MKFLKNNVKLIIGFIVGVILASSISVYAYSYLASDVQYTNEKSVENALNDLYEKINEPLINKIDFSTSRTYYMGNRKEGQTKSITLSKGNYIISVVNAHAWASGSTFNKNGVISSSASSWITVTNGTCEFLTGYYVQPTATNKTDDTKYVSQYTYSNLYKCTLTSDGTISFTTNDGTYNDCTQGIIIQTIKID